MDVTYETLSNAQLAHSLRKAAPDIYHHPDFWTFLEQVTGTSCQLLTAWTGQTVAGVLPLFECRDADGSLVVNSSPWFGSHGGCLVLCADAPAGAAAREALLDAFARHHERSGALSSTVILPRSEMTCLEVYRSRLHPRIEDRRTGQVTSLPADPADLMGLFTGKTRNLVRKGLAQGFTIEEAGDRTDSGACWQALYDIHAENMAALGGQPKPLAHFQALRACFPAGMVRLTVARDGEGRVMAALLLLRQGSTVEYLTPVVRVEARSQQPLSALIHDGMTHAICRGARQWNWGGTWKSQTSLHHFKAGFGARDEEYAYLTLAAPAAVSMLGTARDTLAQRFPYFFVYPYHAFDDAR